MKKIFVVITIITAFCLLIGCSAIKRTNAPEPERKSDNATPKANEKQPPVVEMEE